MTRMYYYVPPISGSTASWTRVAERLRQEPGHEHDRFEHYTGMSARTGIYVSRRPIENVARGIRAHLEHLDRDATRRGAPLTEIVLVGDSIGGPLVRWAWLAARGGIAGEVPVDGWPAKVTRVVLAAGMSRGMVTSLGAERRNLRTLAMKIAAAVFSVFGFTWKGALAGSPFITNLRLAWIRWMAEPRSAGHHDDGLEVVQLLGTDDELVRREDSRDSEQFPGGVHIDVLGARHGDIFRTASRSDEGYGPVRAALLDPVPRTTPPPPPEGDKTDVVFVVHGIRSSAHGWVRRFKAELREEGGQGWLVVDPTYRHFSALAFASPAARRRKVRWFLDQYSAHFARHPRARFHFAGHSNGTYLLGRALQDVPSIRFCRVYLASSVLPVNYGWAERIARRQVATVRSDGGSKDVPVALLAEGLRGLHQNDVGKGGFEGFTELAGVEDDDTFVQWDLFQGGHGAPLADEDRIRSAARYVVGHHVDPPPDLVPRDPPSLLAKLSRIAPGLMLLVVLAALALTAWGLLVQWWLTVAVVLLVVVVLANI